MWGKIGPASISTQYEPSPSRPPARFGRVENVNSSSLHPVKRAFFCAIFLERNYELQSPRPANQRVGLFTNRKGLVHLPWTWPSSLDLNKTLQMQLARSTAKRKDGSHFSVSPSLASTWKPSSRFVRKRQLFSFVARRANGEICGPTARDHSVRLQPLLPSFPHHRLEIY